MWHSPARGCLACAARELCQWVTSVFSGWFEAVEDTLQDFKLEKMVGALDNHVKYCKARVKNIHQSYSDTVCVCGFFVHFLVASKDPVVGLVTPVAVASQLGSTLSSVIVQWSWEYVGQGFVFGASCRSHYQVEYVLIEQPWLVGSLNEIADRSSRNRPHAPFSFITLNTILEWWLCWFCKITDPVRGSLCFPQEHVRPHEGKT